MHNVADIPLVQPDWKHHRVIHSKYPPKNLFDADDAINSLLGEVESLTNERIVNWRDFVLPEDARFGNGWGAVMGSFCYPRLGRFSTERAGAYYCSDKIAVAIAEWCHHTARYWQEFGFDAEVSATVRSYTGHFTQPLLDVRGYPELHGHDATYQYKISNALANQARDAGAYGLLYNSVRHPGGVCAALLRPTATTQVTQSAHYVVIFNGHTFTDFAKLGEFHAI